MKQPVERKPKLSSKISMAELQRKMRDPDTPEDELREFFAFNPEASRPFAPAIIPNPERVAVAAPHDAAEGAMLGLWANSLARLRRQDKFKRRRADGDASPVLVSEGDSWFQFPIFLDDIIDDLFPDYNVWSVDAAGDTLQNMVLDHAEYMQALHENKGVVRAFLFSGGGNDVVGEDASGRPVIPQIVKAFEARRKAEWYVDHEAFRAKLRFIEDCFRKVLTNIGTAYPGLPVICHGYDYAIPGGAEGDPRHPLWAKQDKWIGRPMREDLGIRDSALQCEIIHLMIDRLNERIRALCGGNNPDGVFRNGWHVDLRGTVSSISRWADELHPTNEGFAAVTKRIALTLRSALKSPVNGARDEQVASHPGDDEGVDASERANDWRAPAMEAGAEEVGRWRVAASLLELRRQLDVRFPSRRKTDDGTIGDAAHASRNSDHNPWVKDNGMGVVTAIDVTNDPSSGCIGNWLSEALRASQDSRIKYIIWNRRICSSSRIGAVPAWEWRRYSGSNPHDKHLHLSVKSDKVSYDSAKTWELGRAGGEAVAVARATSDEPLLRSISNPLPRGLEGAVAASPPPREETPGGAGAKSDPSRSFRSLVVKGKGEPMRKTVIRSGLESIIDKDDRIRILDTELMPWRMICALRMRGPNGTGAIGTGWFVGPRTILTAGHCVHSMVFFGGWASKIEISPGRDGAEFPYGTLTSTRFSSVDRWVEKEDADFDIGCIHLDKAPKPSIGWFAVGALPPHELEGYNVNVAGYPQDRGNGTELYHHRNRVLRVTNRRVFYDVDTYGGQSGAPVWIHETENSPPLAIGIHAYGVDGAPNLLQANSAPRIIPKVLEQIRTWVEADGGWPDKA